MPNHRLTSQGASAYFQAGKPWGAVPNYTQLDSHCCGFVAALTVIHCHDPDVPTREVFEYVRPCAIGGCGHSLIMRTLKRFGVVAKYRDRIGQQRLRSLVRDGPVIVTVWPWDWWVDHWCVVRSVDESGQVRLVNHGPPRAGMTWEEFADQWCPKGGVIECSS